MIIGYWHIKDMGDWVELTCPRMEDSGPVSFSVKRKIVESLRHAEQYVKSNKKYKGWLGYTNEKNEKEIGWYIRMGGIPYHHSDNTIFFMKET